MVADYYGELGVSRNASAAELRRAYREQARRLHPDLHLESDREREGDGDAMRRLNEAWQVLGDPQSRRRYDRLLAGDHPSGAGDGLASADDDLASAGDDPAWTGDGLAPGPDPALAGHRLAHSWWLVAVAILAAIFVITAYAARPAPVSPSPGTSRPPSDQCLARYPGYEAFVSCTQPNIGRVVAAYPETASGGSSGTCPAGTVSHPVLGRAEVACLAGGSGG